MPKIGTIKRLPPQVFPRAAAPPKSIRRPPELLPHTEKISAYIVTIFSSVIQPDLSRDGKQNNAVPQLRDKVSCGIMKIIFCKSCFPARS